MHPNLSNGLPGASGLRKNKFAFWRQRRAGRCKAPRRRQCDALSRSGNAADALPPPRPAGRTALFDAICYQGSHQNISQRSRQQNVKLFLPSPLAGVTKAAAPLPHSKSLRKLWPSFQCGSSAAALVTQTKQILILYRIIP
jgi:hypothetical protein